MLLTIAEGPGAGWRGEVVVDDVGLLIDGEGYTPPDDVKGFVIVAATAVELELLRDHGFDLPWLS